MSSADIHFVCAIGKNHRRGISTRHIDQEEEEKGEEKGGGEGGGEGEAWKSGTRSTGGGGGGEKTEETYLIDIVATPRCHSKGPLASSLPDCEL